VYDQMFVSRTMRVLRTSGNTTRRSDVSLLGIAPFDHEDAASGHASPRNRGTLATPPGAIAASERCWCGSGPSRPVAPNAPLRRSRGAAAAPHRQLPIPRPGRSSSPSRLRHRPNSAAKREGHPR
jgi:hypothetical protein